MKKCLITISLLLLALTAYAIQTISDLYESVQLEQIHNRVDEEATLASFAVVGEFCSIDYQGDYEEILANLNSVLINSPFSLNQQFNCSLYSGLGDVDNIFLGRNFDNPTCDLLVGRYDPTEGYRSIALNRINDLGIPTGSDYENLTTAQKHNLLKAPFFTADGINEMGVAGGIAYVPAVPVTIDPDKETIWLTLWLRKILDNAATVEEAITISNSYNVIDNFYGQNTLCHHLLLSDSSGNSTILEYIDGQFRAISPEVPWQVLTNSTIYDVPLQQLFSQCWRYQLLYNTLSGQDGIITDWRNGMDILAMPSWGDVTNGTQWSSLFNLNEKQIYVSVRREYENIARVDLESFDFINFGNFYLNNTIIQDENCNGIYEKGESIDIIAAINADFNSYGVTGVLTAEDQEVFFFNSTADFGDIISNQMIMNIANPFQIQIPENYAYSVIDFTINLTTNYGYSHIVSFSIPVSNVTSEEISLAVTQPEIKIYPNPFYPGKVKHDPLINFQLISGTKLPPDTVIEIFNLKGQKVYSSEVNQTTSDITLLSWNGNNSAGKEVVSGVYYCILNNRNNILAAKKIVIFR